METTADVDPMSVLLMQKTQTEKAKDHLRVNLPIWNGPLDLLLDLIRTSEINIYDIPIKEITGQYLNTIKLMQKLNIELASEFLSMAATLVYIKSRVLLPHEIRAAEDEEFQQDPRKDLVHQLLEYQKFKNLAEKLEGREIHFERLIERRDHQITFETKQDPDEIWKEITLFELVKVFSGVVDAIEYQKNDILLEEEYRVEDKIEYIEELLGKKEKVNFYDLFQENSVKIEIIVTFWAILEMYKHGKITLQQHTFFGDIFLFRQKPTRTNMTS